METVHVCLQELIRMTRRRPAVAEALTGPKGRAAATQLGISVCRSSSASHDGDQQ